MRASRVKAAALLEAAAAHHREGRLRDAESAYRRVLAIDPANGAAMNMLGLIAHARGDGEAAVHLMRASIALGGAVAAYWYNLGTVLESRGDIPGAVAAYRQAAALDPSDVTNWSSAIFNGDLHPYSTPDVRLADRRTFNQAHCAALTAAARPHENDRDPERRLRVGYLSADFVDHSAALVFAPIIEGHDRAQAEVYLYWQRRQKPDAVTVRFVSLADHWREVHALSDDDLAETIRADEIDILVDLSGYSNGHRLLALARKPAPIVITGWGHITGLGIDASDYLVADAVTVPPESAWQHREQVLRLPCLLAFDVGPGFEVGPAYPDVAPPPAARNGYTTFGYFGRATKTSEQVWSAWASILGRVPNSRLILKGREYGDAGYRARIVELFASLRVSSNRLEFRGPTTRQEHLAAYNDVDIALDAWPQNSGVTTLEACLMGVPTVTLLGDHLNGRIGASILSTLDRAAWVGLGVEHYVEIAAALARGAITHDRASLRADFLGSIICDPVRYAASVEGIYRQAWRAWAGAPSRELAPVGG